MDEDDYGKFRPERVKAGKLIGTSNASDVMPFETRHEVIDDDHVRHIDLSMWESMFYGK